MSPPISACSILLKILIYFYGLFCGVFRLFFFCWLFYFIDGIFCVGLIFFMLERKIGFLQKKKVKRTFDFHGNLFFCDVLVKRWKKRRENIKNDLEHFYIIMEPFNLVFGCLLVVVVTVNGGIFLVLALNWAIYLFALFWILLTSWILCKLLFYPHSFLEIPL